MSVLFSGTNQGSFVSTGESQIIQLPTGVDWMWVKNLTVSYAAGADTGAEFYWQLGMAQGRGTVYEKTTGTNALQVGQIGAGEGFYLVNNTVNVPGASLPITGITDDTPPVVETGDTTGLVDGNIVRIFNTVGARQLAGLDFTVGAVVGDTSFELINMSTIADANPGAGTYRIIPFNPYFYPSSRYITEVSQENQALVTLSVTHFYQIGQSVRIIMPTVSALAYGMTELDGIEATIVDINEEDVNGSTNTIRINVDSSGFNAFAFPLTANYGFTPAQVVPIGEDTAFALINNDNILSDATVNQGFFGMQLQAGDLSPAGVADDDIFWVAGKSFNVD